MPEIDIENAPSFRAFCENGDCTWSSDGTFYEEGAHVDLEEHAKKKHPDEPVKGSVDEL